MFLKTVCIQATVSIFVLVISDCFYTNFIRYQTPEEAYRSPHPVYHHTLTSSYDGIGFWGGSPYRVCTDWHGFKNDCSAVSEAHLNYDIAFIGDSFTEAVGLPYEKSFVGKLANQRRDLKVANLGVSSYSPTIYFAKIKHLMEQGLRFDHVFVFIDISDIQDESWYFTDRNGYVLRRYNGASERPVRLTRVVNILKQNLSLTHAAYVALKQLIVSGSKVDSRQPFDQSRSTWTYDARSDGYGDLGVSGSIEKAVVQMKSLYEFLERQGIGLSVAVYPWPAQLREMELTESADNRQVAIWRDFCESRCSSFIDFFPVFNRQVQAKSARAVYEMYYISGDVHFNEEGNSLIFDGLSGLDLVRAR